MGANLDTQRVSLGPVTLSLREHPAGHTLTTLCPLLRPQKGPYSPASAHPRTWLLISGRGEGWQREREGEKYWCEGGTLINCLSHMPWLKTKPNLQPRYVTWRGIEPVAFRFTDDTPTNWSTPARTQHPFLNAHKGSNEEATRFLQACVYFLSCHRSTFSLTRNLVFKDEESPCNQLLLGIFIIWSMNKFLIKK